MTQTSGRARSAAGSRNVVRSLPQETTEPRLRVMHRRRVSGRTVLIWAASFFFVVLAGSVTIQAQRIETQHDIDRIELETARADELNRQLRAEVAIAESPEWIIDAARAAGMVDPGAVVPLLPGGADPVLPDATAEGSDQR